MLNFRKHEMEEERIRTESREEMGGQKKSKEEKIKQKRRANKRSIDRWGNQ